MKLQLRRDTAALWASKNPVLLPGEPGYSTDDKVLKIGDGFKTWAELEGIAGGLSYKLELLKEATPADIVLWGGSIGTFTDQDTGVPIVSKLYEENFGTLTAEEQALFISHSSVEMNISVPAHAYPEKGYYLEIEMSPRNTTGTFVDEFSNSVVSDFVPGRLWHNLFLNEVAFEYSVPIELTEDVIYEHYGSWARAGVQSVWTNVGTNGAAGEGTPEAWSDGGGGGSDSRSYIEYGMQGSRKGLPWYIAATRITLKMHLAINQDAPGISGTYECECFALEKETAGGPFVEHSTSIMSGSFSSKTFSTTLDHMLLIFYPRDIVANVTLDGNTDFNKWNYKSPAELKNPANWNVFSIKLYSKV